jgi:hypothetical protein
VALTITTADCRSEQSMRAEATRVDHKTNHTCDANVGALPRHTATDLEEPVGRRRAPASDVVRRCTAGDNHRGYLPWNSAG